MEKKINHFNLKLNIFFLPQATNTLFKKVSSGHFKLYFHSILIPIFPLCENKINNNIWPPIIIVIVFLTLEKQQAKKMSHKHKKKRECDFVWSRFYCCFYLI